MRNFPNNPANAGLFFCKNEEENKDNEDYTHDFEIDPYKTKKQSLTQKGEALFSLLSDLFLRCHN